MKTCTQQAPVTIDTMIFLIIATVISLFHFPSPVHSAYDFKVRTYDNGFLFEEFYSVTFKEIVAVSLTIGVLIGMALTYVLYKNVTARKFIGLEKRTDTSRQLFDVSFFLLLQYKLVA